MDILDFLLLTKLSHTPRARRRDFDIDIDIDIDFDAEVRISESMQTGWWYTEEPWGGAWSVTGDDTWAFLQSQAAHDLGRGAPKPLVWTLWLDRTGHVQGATWVRPGAAGAAELRAEVAPADGWRERLEGSIIADDVTLAEVGEGWRRVTVSTEGGAALGVAEPAAGGVVALEGMSAWASREVPGAWEVDVPAERWAVLEAAWQALGGVRETASAREVRRVRAGVPAVPTDIGPGELPQEGGLERTGVSFQKGCYLGQEVMARLAAQGRTRRTLRRVLLANGRAFTPSTRLYVGSEVAGNLRSIGEAGAEGHPWALALLKDRWAQAGTGLALTPDGEVVATVQRPLEEGK